MIDEANIDCALEALRDRTPGMVSWNAYEYYGQFSDEGAIHIRSDGAAIREHFAWQDLCVDYYETQVGTLPPAEYYAECLTDPDPYARFDCIRAPLAEMNAVCEAEYRECEDG